MKTNELLIEARRLIEKPEHWTTGESWRDSNGRKTCTVAEAVKYCGYGAISAVIHRAGMKQSTLHTIATDAVEKSAGTRFFDQFNDTHTHAEVLEVFDRAIAATA